MPISDKQLAANRANAAKSTGPRTPEGKAVSRLNAMRHTLCSQTVVSTKNNLFAYARFRKRFFDDLQPTGIVEVQLTQTLADCSWRLNCARAYETNLLTLGTEEQAKTIVVEMRKFTTRWRQPRLTAIRCAPSLPSVH